MLAVVPGMGRLTGASGATCGAAGHYAAPLAAGGFVGFVSPGGRGDTFLRSQASSPAVASPGISLDGETLALGLGKAGGKFPP